MSEKTQKIIEEIKALSVVELNELVKALEEEFGVSAMPVMTAPAAASQQGAEAEAVSATVNLVLVDTGPNKIQVIKVLRELNPNLSLKDANYLVSSPPKTLAENLERNKAEEFKKKFEAAGAKVELK